MEWPSWYSMYDDNVYMPRIVIKWGHSLCEKCIRKIIIKIEQGYEQNWSECHSFIQYDAFVSTKDRGQLNEKYIQSIMEAFPKNLALLKSYTLEQSPSDLFKNTLNWDSNSQKNCIEKRKSTKINDIVCKLHPLKGIEAFCVEDRALLCLDWILSNNHRGHEISSITHGYSIRKGEFEELRYLSDEKQKKLNEGKDQLQRDLLTLMDLDKKTKKNINKMFQKISDVIEKWRLDEQFQRQNEFNLKKNKISKNLVEFSNLMRKISDIKIHMEKLETMPKLEFLIGFDFDEMNWRITETKIPKWKIENNEQLEWKSIINRIWNNISMVNEDLTIKGGIAQHLSSTLTSNKSHYKTRENPLQANFTVSAVKNSSKCK